ncbi:DUF2255 family protein [Mesorhizobium sp. LjNodule214]|uniref:DUF2255 family protein n=1 Tax=Mesorhizobium sp. LjNodule214 TaxID=3342252 RepID=UPI003ECD4718
MTWTPETLQKIAASDDLHIAPFREDGTTYGTLTWIWSVVVGNDLFVRGYNGPKSRWYQAAVRQRAGKITAAGLALDAAFEPVDGAVNDAVDAAYKKKYATSPYLAPMVGSRARSATIKISPRNP